MNSELNPDDISGSKIVELLRDIEALIPGRSVEYKDACDKVVAWWMKKALVEPPGSNIGDTSAIGALAVTLHDQMAEEARKAASPDRVAVLTLAIVRELLRIPVGQSTLLSVDYEPCERLARALSFAGIGRWILPVKSYTRIDNEHRAFCKCGYGAAEVEL